MTDITPYSYGNRGFATFAEFQAHLDKLGMFRMTPGIDRVAATLDSLHLRRPPFTVIQVVGTNGKGSTSTMLASLGLTHGLRVGLHTSPHFVSIRERVRINDSLIGEAAWLKAANSLLAHGGSRLSYFEYVTCLSLLLFAENKVDLAIMETGLGGTFDATTALEADLVVFTPIALDHQTILGNSLRAIARDKAGAVRTGKPVVSARQPEAAWQEIHSAAAARQAELLCVDELPETTGRSAVIPAPGLQGEHQKANASLALLAWRLLRIKKLLSAAALATVGRHIHQYGQGRLEQEGVSRAWLPGRMQFIQAVAFPQDAAAAFGHNALSSAGGTPRHAGSGPAVPSFPCDSGWPALLLDGAHNSHGLQALGHSLALTGIAPAAVIFSCLADKEPDTLIPHLRALATGPVFVPPIPDNPRAIAPEELAKKIGLNAVPVSSMQQALHEACKHMEERLPESFTGMRPENPLLICGSLYLLGEFFALRPDCLAPA